MNDEEQAAMFKALGDPTRLRIFNYLCSCAPEVTVDDAGDVRSIVGPTVGEVCCHLNGDELGRSNVSFHLKELRHSGLITMEKRGKHIVCAVVPETILLLSEYFAKAGLRSCDTFCREKEKVAG